MERPYANLLDLLLEINPSGFALNKRWGPGKQLSRAWFNDKKLLRQEMKQERRGYAKTEPVRAGLFFSSGCDIDAPLKAVFDAGQKAVYADDSQIEDAVLHVVREDEPWILIMFEFLCSPRDSAIVALYEEMNG